MLSTLYVGMCVGIVKLFCYDATLTRLARIALAGLGGLMLLIVADGIDFVLCS